MYFINDKTELDQNLKFIKSSEEKQNFIEVRQASSPSAKDQQKKEQKKVTFNEKIQYFYYEETYEDYREAKYNRFIKDLWRKQNEVSKQIEQFTVLQENQVPPKQQTLLLVSIHERLQQQAKRYIDYLSNTLESPVINTGDRKISVIQENEEEEDPEENTNTAETTAQLLHKDKLTNENNKQLVIRNPMTSAQKIILANTEKSSMPYIMTELEMVRKEIDIIIRKAKENRHDLASQLTNDKAKTNELVKLTSSKRINEERKWDDITKRVGNQRAEKMKSNVTEMDEEAQKWWKERQEKLSLAENLMLTVNKERSASCRIQMVMQRPELSREIVIVEAAKILAFIKVKSPQKTTNLDQWLNEQYYVLTAKMSVAQANSVIQEVYDKLPTDND